MSYDLEVHGGIARDAALSPEALIAQVRLRIPALAHRAMAYPFRSDGAGFAIPASTDRTVHLVASAQRGPDDEYWMEGCALVLAGTEGQVVDRHTGHHWPVALLERWLLVAPLLSGRALAVNEARIARALAQQSLDGFEARITAVARACASAPASDPLRTRLHGELQHYAARPALRWASATGLAQLGDFEKLESLALSGGDDAHEAFARFASFGARSVASFQRAFAHPDPNCRRAAVRALHTMNDPAVIPLLALALSDKRSTVREAALEGDPSKLFALPGAQSALAPVLARLEHDTSSVVRKLLVRWRA